MSEGGVRNESVGICSDNSIILQLTDLHCAQTLQFEFSVILHTLLPYCKLRNFLMKHPSLPFPSSSRTGAVRVCAEAPEETWQY